MGIAFMVLCPVAFCDVTDSWRLSSRKKRIQISFAGIITELVLAGFALLAWGILPDGALKSVCFVFSSVTIISTLLVNLNPAMRFDGYYIFSDLFGIDNLQQTGFAHARGVLYRAMFGIPYTPADNYSRRQKIFMMFYSVNTWIYRFGLYLGIAVMVYYKFTKTLGIVLFLTELIFFLVKPIVRQIMTVWTMRKMMKPRRVLLILTILVLLVGWCAIPLPRKLKLPAITELSVVAPVYAAQSGVLVEVNCDRDQWVETQQVLFRVESQSLLNEIEQLELELKRLELEVGQLASGEAGKAALPAKREEMARTSLRLESARQKAMQCSLRSTLDGLVYQWDESIEEGLPVKRGQYLCRIGHPDSMLVKAYIKESDLKRLSNKKTCSFVDGASLRRYSARILRLNQLRSRFIPYQSLTSLAGGDIAVISRGNVLEALESYYEAEVELIDDGAGQLRINQVGRLEVMSRPRSLISRLVDVVYSVFVRESAF